MYKSIDKETVGLIKSQTAEMQQLSYDTDIRLQKMLKLLSEAIKSII